MTTTYEVQYSNINNYEETFRNDFFSAVIELLNNSLPDLKSELNETNVQTVAFDREKITIIINTPEEIETTEE